MRMCDALAAIVDVRLRPPRQGDADDGHGLVVDGAGTHRWATLLHTGDALFGRQSLVAGGRRGDDVRTPLLAVADQRRAVRRGPARPSARRTSPTPA